MSEHKTTPWKAEKVPSSSAASLFRLIDSCGSIVATVFPSLGRDDDVGKIVHAVNAHIEAAHQCFCTEQAIDRVSQFLIDSGLIADPHAAQTQATFLVIGVEEGCMKKGNVRE